jgi:hypothetical protein
VTEIPVGGSGARSAVAGAGAGRTVLHTAQMSVGNVGGYARYSPQRHVYDCGNGAAVRVAHAVHWTTGAPRGCTRICLQPAHGNCPVISGGSAPRISITAAHAGHCTRAAPGG